MGVFLESSFGSNLKDRQHCISLKDGGFLETVKSPVPIQPFIHQLSERAPFEDRFSFLQKGTNTFPGVDCVQ